MIVLVTGPPGNGKSFYAIRKVAQALEDGKIVASNVQLREDWVEFLAKRNVVRHLKPGATRRFRKTAASRYHYSEDLDELFRLRLRGSGESRGVMVLDEAHNWMNARAWTADDRQTIVRFASQHRKLGWDVYVLAQQAEMLDKQVRNLFEYHVQLRNLRRARYLGIPISPINLFLGVWLWHSAQRVVLKREVFRLSYHKKLYDTYQLSHGLVGDDAAAIWLPSDPAARTASPPHAADAGVARADAGAGDPARAPESEPAQVPAWDLATDDEAADAETGDPRTAPHPGPVANL